MPESISRPTAEMLANLSMKERALFRVARTLNDSAPIKRALYHYVRTIGVAWVDPCVRRILRVHGRENLQGIGEDEPVLLLANHRSYFDFYIVMEQLLQHTRLGRNGIYFPVRGNFYYDRVTGLLLNLVIGGLSMYPPVFRDASKRELNQYTVDRLLELCRTPGVMVGFHPEGTRNQGADPYTLLPAQPGVGKLVLEARPRVVPMFVNGLSNNFVRQVAQGYVGKAQPIYIVFGKPIDLAEFAGVKSRLTTQKKVADRLCAILADLGQEEKRLRAAAGESLADA